MIRKYLFLESHGKGMKEHFGKYADDENKMIVLFMPGVSIDEMQKGMCYFTYFSRFSLPLI